MRYYFMVSLLVDTIIMKTLLKRIIGGKTSVVILLTLLLQSCGMLMYRNLCVRQDMGDGCAGSYLINTSDGRVIITGAARDMQRSNVNAPSYIDINCSGQYTMCEDSMKILFNGKEYDSCLRFVKDKSLQHLSNYGVKDTIVRIEILVDDIMGRTGCSINELYPITIMPCGFLKQGGMNVINTTIYLSDNLL